METIGSIAILTTMAVSGAIGYAMRGGQFRSPHCNKSLRKIQLAGDLIPQGDRLLYIVPTCLSVLLLTFLPLQTAIFFVALFAAIVLGHGVVMDMGRFNPGKTLDKSRHQFPVTYMIGRENYHWSFGQKWLHNCIGMLLLGALRWSPVWAFYGHINTNYLVGCTLAGMVLHPLAYELGWQIEKYKLKKLDGTIAIRFAERATGAALNGSIACTLIAGG